MYENHQSITIHPRILAFQSYHISMPSDENNHDFQRSLLKVASETTAMNIDSNSNSMMPTLTPIVADLQSALTMLLPRPTQSQDHKPRRTSHLTKPNSASPQTIASYTRIPHQFDLTRQILPLRSKQTPMYAVCKTTISSRISR